MGSRTISILLVCLSWNHGSASQAQSVTGVDVPDGFRVTKVAGDDLATNVYCLTVSPKGEVFVAGPGYIKALIDTDGDGIFDSTRQFAAAPISGAQGMCFDGNDLLCTGDGGLLRFSDSDGDGVADGPPNEMLSIKTGGEHDAHAIRRGPDGWWYLLAGNGTPILPEYHSGKNSPVKAPRAGFLMRISPDWSEKEIFCHGFRNAYDFDFNSRGRIFVYDSDGERDITLPWYRPTRVYRMRPGDDAGWVEEGWKRPSYFFDMPIEIGALGRGSPTGVVVNSFKQFPHSYQDAVFVADWTFGRVIAFRRDVKTRNYDQGTEFAVADGQFGFAVTDLDFAKDGSLLISVGGRGTQGSVYRVKFTGDANNFPEFELSPTEAFSLQSKSIRLSADELIDKLFDPSKSNQVAALEAIIGRNDLLGPKSDLKKLQRRNLARGLANACLEADPKTLGMVWRIASELDARVFSQVKLNDLPVESKLILKLAIARDESARRELVLTVAQELTKAEGDARTLSRIAQLALGGCGGNGSKPMFVGHTARLPIDFSEQQLAAITSNLTTSLELGFAGEDQNSRHSQGNDEIVRLAGMLSCRSTRLQESIARFLGQDRSAVSRDIHWLNCISRTSNERASGFSEPVETKIADTLVGLSRRIQSQGLDLDRNFYPRMKTLVNSLFKKCEGALANRTASQISGDGGDAYLIESLPEEARAIGLERFASRIEQYPGDVTSTQIQVLASHPSSKHVKLIRKFGSRPELRDAVSKSLSKYASPEDRDLFVQGLRSSDLETLKQSAKALQQLPEDSKPIALIYALLASRKLGWDRASVRVRDELVLLLQKWTDQNFGYQPKEDELNQNDVLQEWSHWIRETYPEEFEAAFQNPKFPAFAERIESVDWNSGDADRGRHLYKKLRCSQCHDGGTRLGPRLGGITKRLGHEDLFRSIVLPNEQVPERYRMLVVETVDGKLFRGSVVYESVDGITLQESGGQTVRINRKDIEARVLSEKSLMPEGLLRETADQDWSDLYAYLKSQ